MASSTNKVDNKLSNHASAGNAITSYITNVSTMNESTAHQYLSRLKNFDDFIAKTYNSDVDSLLLKIKQGNQDPFGLLNAYAAYMKNRNISPLTLNQRIVTVKNFFEYNDIEISQRRFKLKVKLPKIVRKKKEALSKKEILKY